jgi:hypothetical protein
MSTIFKLGVDKSFIMGWFEVGVYLGIGFMVAVLFFLFEWLFRMMKEDKIG